MATKKIIVEQDNSVHQCHIQLHSAKKAHPAPRLMGSTISILDEFKIWFHPALNSRICWKAKFNFLYVKFVFYLHIRVFAIVKFHAEHFLFDQHIPKTASKLLYKFAVNSTFKQLFRAFFWMATSTYLCSLVKPVWGLGPIQRNRPKLKNGF